MATIQRVKFVKSLMLIHITIVKKYTIISITWGYYLLPWQPFEVVGSTCMYVQTYNGCVYYHMAMVVVGYM